MNSLSKISSQSSSIRTFTFFRVSVGFVFIIDKSKKHFICSQKIFHRNKNKMQIWPDLNSNSRRHNSKSNDFLSVNRVDTTVQSIFLVCFHNQLSSWFTVDHWIWQRISSKPWWFSLLSVLRMILYPLPYVGFNWSIWSFAFGQDD